jgi:hypothetical protein
MESPFKVSWLHTKFNIPMLPSLFVKIRRTNRTSQVKKSVREIESEDGCLIFDDTVQEKKWTDESNIMC